MLEVDLLYPSGKKRKDYRKKNVIDDNTIDDLKIFSFLTTAINHGKNNNEFNEIYSDVFYDELINLPTDTDIIKYRQNILLDLISNEVMLDKLIEICNSLQKNLPYKRFNVYQRHVPLETKLRKYVNLLEDNYKILYEGKYRFKGEIVSEEVKSIFDFFTDEEAKKNISEIISITQEVLKNGSFKFSVNSSKELKLQSIKLIQKLKMHVIPTVLKKGFIKRKLLNTDLYIEGVNNFIIKKSLDEIYEKILVSFCGYISLVNTALIEPLLNIKKDLLFYKGAVEIYKSYNYYDLPFSMPKVLDKEENRTIAEGLYDTSLLVKAVEQNFYHKIKQIVRNDFDDKDARITLITGLNQGGKTTFLNSLGIAQILMQLGMHVPAVKFSSSPASYIASHFPSNEDTEMEHGKLEEELLRIKSIFSNVKEGSYIFFNESFATTAEDEGVEIAFNVLKALSQLKTRVIFVTHLFSLASGIDELNAQLDGDEKAVNYVTELIKGEDSEKIRRTYKIIKGEPQKDMYAELMLKKYLNI